MENVRQTTSKIKNTKQAYQTLPLDPGSVAIALRSACAVNPIGVQVGVSAVMLHLTTNGWFCTLFLSLLVILQKRTNRGDSETEDWRLPEGAAGTADMKAHSETRPSALQMGRIVSAYPN